MKTNQVVQLNRGRCVYRSYQKQEVTEDINETSPLNQHLEDSQTETTVPETERQEENIKNKKPACQ